MSWYRDLFLAVQEANLQPPPAAVRQNALTGGLEKIGRATNAVGNDLVAIATMLGAVVISFARAVARP